MPDRDRRKSRLQDILDVALPVGAFFISAATPGLGRGIATGASIASQRLKSRLAEEESERKQREHEAGAPGREAQAQAQGLVGRTIFQPNERSQQRVSSALSRGFEGGNMMFDLPPGVVQANTQEAASNLAQLRSRPGGAELLALAGGPFGKAQQAGVAEQTSGASALAARTSAAKEARVAAQPQKIDFGYGDKLDAKIVTMFPDVIEPSVRMPTAAEVGMARTALVQEEEARDIRVSSARGREAGQLRAQQMAADRRAKRDFELNKPLAEAQGDKAAFFVYTGKQEGTAPGQSVEQGLGMQDVYGLIGSGVAKRLTAKQFEAIEVRRQLAPIIQSIRDRTQQLYETGLYADVGGAGLLQRVIRGGRTVFNQLTQNEQQAIILARDIASNVDLVRRAVLEQVGTQTERDAIRGLQTFVDNTGLLTDSKEVAYGTTNNLIRTVNAAMQTTLDNPGVVLVEPLITEADLPPLPQSEDEAQAIFDRLKTRYPNESRADILLRINRGER